MILVPKNYKTNFKNPWCYKVEKQVRGSSCPEVFAALWGRPMHTHPPVRLRIKLTIIEPWTGQKRGGGGGEELCRESQRGEGFPTRGMGGKHQQSGTARGHAAWPGWGLPQVVWVTEGAPAKTQILCPCDFLVDPTPQQVRETQGTGWGDEAQVGLGTLNVGVGSSGLILQEVSSRWCLSCGSIQGDVCN